MIKQTKKKIGAIISLLLTVSLLTVTAVEISFAAYHPEKDLKPVLQAQSLMVRAIGTTIGNQRVNLKSFTGFFESALVFEQTSMDLIRTSVPFRTGLTDRFAQCEGQASIIIRAPPCPHS